GAWAGGASAGCCLARIGEFFAVLACHAFHSIFSGDYSSPALQARASDPPGWVSERCSQSSRRCSLASAAVRRRAVRPAVPPIRTVENIAGTLLQLSSRQ